jgi:hypothetical protein
MFYSDIRHAISVSLNVNYISYILEEHFTLEEELSDEVLREIAIQVENKLENHLSMFREFQLPEIIFEIYEATQPPMPE